MAETHSKIQEKAHGTGSAEVRARLRYLRMSPVKIRLVANFVKGMDVQEALAQLHFMKRHAKVPVMKLIQSAVSNAVNNYHLDKNNLFIKTFTVDGGPMLKRWRARAYGRAGMIRKRTSHLNIVLSEKVASSKHHTAPVKADAEGDVKVVSGESVKSEHALEQKHDDKSGHAHKDVKKTNIKGFTKKLFSRKTG